MSWTQTHSGIRFELENPTPEMINLSDLSVSLSRQVRFNGHTKDGISVAQHSVLVGSMIRGAGGSREEILAGYIHDCHEAYLTDFPSPLKWVLADVWESFKVIEGRVDKAVADHFGIDVDLMYSDIVKQADVSALWHEKHAQFDDNGEDWQWEKVLKGYDIFPMPKGWNLVNGIWGEYTAQSVFMSSINAVLDLNTEHV